MDCMLIKFSSYKISQWSKKFKTRKIHSVKVTSDYGGSIFVDLGHLGCTEKTIWSFQYLKHITGGWTWAWFVLEIKLINKMCCFVHVLCVVSSLQTYGDPINQWPPKCSIINSLVHVLQREGHGFLNWVNPIHLGSSFLVAFHFS